MIPCFYWELQLEYRFRVGEFQLADPNQSLISHEIVTVFLKTYRSISSRTYIHATYKSTYVSYTPYGHRREKSIARTARASLQKTRSIKEQCQYKLWSFYLFLTGKKFYVSFFLFSTGNKIQHTLCELCIFCTLNIHERK